MPETMSSLKDFIPNYNLKYTPLIKQKLIMFIKNIVFDFCYFLSNTLGLSSMERHGIMELCKILGYSFYFQLRINDEKSHSEIYGLHSALLTISIYINGRIK